MTASDIKTIEAYRATGRLVFIRPRKRQISLNGGGFRPAAEQIAKMAEQLSKTS